MDAEVLLLPQYAQSCVEARQEAIRTAVEVMHTLKETFAHIAQTVVHWFHETIVEPIRRWFTSPPVQHLLASLRHRFIANRLGMTPPRRRPRTRNTRLIKTAQKRMALGQDVLRRDGVALHR